MNDKYTLTDESKIYYSKTLYRIKALKDFGDVKAGDIGGFIEKEANLSTSGNAWVRGNAQVYGDARVYGNVQVCGNAWVRGYAQVYGGTHKSTIAIATRSDGYTFAGYMASGELRITAGCRDFNWGDAVSHWDRDDHPKRAESMRIIQFLRAQVEAAA